MQVYVDYTRTKKYNKGVGEGVLSSLSLIIEVCALVFESGWSNLSIRQCHTRLDEYFFIKRGNEMNSKLVYELTVCETDINGAIKRFSGNEELYLSYLKYFVDEPTETVLGDAIKNREWDEAFTAAHALKGVAANLGLTPLFHALGELIIQLRTGKMAEILISYDEVNRCYEDVISALKKGKLVDEEKNYE